MPWIAEAYEATGLITAALMAVVGGVLTVSGIALAILN
jgi:hypothetical protein